ncbi:MAG: nucleotidyltransferase domain-containing protein [Planctomycetaceae bacterium]|jgi:predicted nucleotidyltransferase|nr:nucleotidyltransferase domain-containing protein [Planctomycetaceae bacterium]
MRITETEKQVMIEAVKNVDTDAELWLFGSRVDDTKKGGDIDIAILSPKIDRMKKIQIRRDILDRIGEQKIDIVISRDGSEPFFRLAKENGVQISGKLT